MQKKQVTHITDLILTNQQVAGIWVYVDSLTKECSYSTTVVGKGEGVPIIGGANHILISPQVSNFRYHWHLLKNKKKIVSQSSILQAHRPDFLYWFRNAKIPKIVTMHGNPKSILKTKSWLHYVLYTFLEKKTLPKVQKVIFVDTNTMKEYQRDYPDIKDKFIHIPSGVDTTKFILKKAKKEYYIYLGRLTKEKRVDLIIKSYGLVEGNMPLYIVGEGKEKKALLKLAEHDKRIRFLGTIPHNDLPPVLSKAQGLIMMSSTEGLPLSVLEALACGVSVVTTPVGQLSTLIKKNYNGLFVDNSLPKDLLKQTQRIHSNNCVKSIQHYTWSSIAKRTEKIYREVSQ